MLFTAVVALTESVCCVCRDKHHIKKKKHKTQKNPLRPQITTGEDCIYVTAEASEAESACMCIYEDVLHVFTSMYVQHANIMLL